LHLLAIRTSLATVLRLHKYLLLTELVLLPTLIGTLGPIGVADHAIYGQVQAHLFDKAAQEIVQGGKAGRGVGALCNEKIAVVAEGLGWVGITLCR
jgi:hypothetical protein